MNDYGSAWRILRISSLTDQIFIKAQRIRSIEQKGEQKIKEGVGGEFVGIVNYAIVGLIQLDLGVSELAEEMDYNEVMNIFSKHANVAKELMIAKNHDYGEAWRDMRVSSPPICSVKRFFCNTQFFNFKFCFYFHTSTPYLFYVIGYPIAIFHLLPEDHIRYV